MKSLTISQLIRFLLVTLQLTDKTESAVDSKTKRAHTWSHFLLSILVLRTTSYDMRIAPITYRLLY